MDWTLHRATGGVVPIFQNLSRHLSVGATKKATCAALIADGCCIGRILLCLGLPTLHLRKDSYPPETFRARLTHLPPKQRHDRKPEVGVFEACAHSQLLPLLLDFAEGLCRDFVRRSVKFVVVVDLEL